jgi:MFS family permease
MEPPETESPGPGNAGGAGLGNPDTALIPLYIIAAVLDAGFGSVFVLLAEIRDLYELSSFGVGLIGGSGFVSAFVAQVGLARFADRGHARLMMGLGLAMSALAMLAMIFADSLGSFVLGRILFGLGEGMLLPAARRVAIAHDPSRAGEFLGRLSAAQMTGFLAGPMLGSVMHHGFGLRSTFALTLVMILACAPLVIRIRIPAQGRASPRGRPVLRTLLAKRRMQALLCAAVGYYGSFGVYEAIWAIFLSDLGASQLFIGLNMTLFALPVIFVAPQAGRLAERQGSMRVTCIAILITLPFVAAYGFLENLVLLTCLMVVQAVADAVVMPASQLAVAEASGDDLASGQGLFNATGLAAGATVALLSGAIYDDYGPALLFSLVAGLMAATLLIAMWMTRAEIRTPAPGSVGGSVRR